LSEQETLSQSYIIHKKRIGKVALPIAQANDVPPPLSILPIRFLTNTHNTKTGTFAGASFDSVGINRDIANEIIHVKNE